MKEIFARLIGELEAGRGVVLATIVAEHGSTPRGAGAQMLTGESGRLCGTIGGGSIEHESQRLAARLLAEKRSELHRFELGGGEGSLDMICGGGVTVWLQYIPADDAWLHTAREALRRMEANCSGRLVLYLNGSPAALEEGGGRCKLEEDRFSMPLPIGERAIIFGGGHCALALAPVLHSVGFHVTVFDERSEFLTEDRFPTAERLICGEYLRVAEHIELTGSDYIVVMTNGHKHDLQVEEQVLRGEFAYLGVMGSKRKTAAINEELLHRGLTERDLKRVHAPIGLDIKSATPEEIAVSIAGEMIFVRAQNREHMNGEQGRPCPV